MKNKSKMTLCQQKKEKNCSFDFGNRFWRKYMFLEEFSDFAGIKLQLGKEKQKS